MPSKGRLCVVERCVSEKEPMIWVETKQLQISKFPSPRRILEKPNPRIPHLDDARDPQTTQEVAPFPLLETDDLVVTKVQCLPGRETVAFEKGKTIGRCGLPHHVLRLEA
jgi:hypothetical protein